MCNTLRHNILTWINSERASQDEEWGGIGNDKTLSDNDWLNHIYKQMCLLEDIEDTREGRTARYIKIAALAVAAIEAQV